MMVRHIRLDRRQFYLFEGLGINSLLALASLIVGNGDRIGRAHRVEKGFNADMLGTPEQLYKKPQYTT